MKSRMIRLSAATLLVGAAGMTFWPQVMSYVSTSAVVNAPVARIKAPFNGIVTEISVGSAGTAVDRKQPLLAMIQARAASGEITVIDAEARVVQAGISSLETQIASVRAVADDLGKRITAHRTEARRMMEANTAIVSADLQKAEAAHDLSQREFERIRRLAANGTVPGSKLETARMQFAITKAELDRVRGETAKLDLEKGALERGVLLGTSVEGAGYARQRLDEVTLSLADLQARLAVLRARAASISETRDETQTDLATQRSFTPESAVEGVIWRAAPKVGSEIAIGDTLVEILDCDRRFLEVSLPERYFERIRPGDAAIVQLKGARDTLTATVSAVGGSSARLNDESFAAERPRDTGNAAQVLLDLPPAVIEGRGNSSGFCNVGRTAEVRFPRAEVSGLGERLAAVLGGFGSRLLRLT